MQENKRQSECEAIARAGAFLEEDSEDISADGAQVTGEEDGSSDRKKHEKSFQHTRELKVLELKEKSSVTKEETLRSRETVEAFSRYKVGCRDTCLLNLRMRVLASFFLGSR